jgi:hypothetical protein
LGRRQPKTKIYNNNNNNLEKEMAMNDLAPIGLFGSFSNGEEMMSAKIPNSAAHNLKNSP